MTTAPPSLLVLDQYVAAAGPLTEVVHAAPVDRWDDPSPCEGWAARDVLSHLVDTQRDFLRGRGLSERSAGTSDTATETDPVVGWDTQVAYLRDLLSQPEVISLGYDGFFGPTTVGETLLQFYIPDMLVHRWDLASAVGGDTRLSEQELTLLNTSVDGWGDALYMDGICRPGVTAPAGADRQTILLARMGRRSW